MREFSIVAMVSSCLVFGCTGRADPPAPEPTRSATVDALRTDLRTIMSAQEEYYSEHGTYAATLELLRARDSLRLPSEGRAEVVGAPNSYVVTMTKSLSVGEMVSCRVAVGSGGENEGRIVCDYRATVVQAPRAVP